MSLLADYLKLPADQMQLATLNGSVVTAQASLDAANAAVAAQNTQITADTAAVVADLQAAPYSGSAVVVDTTQSPLVSVVLLTVVPPATDGAPAGLSAQTINVAV